jgi:hypothetical protein
MRSLSVWLLIGWSAFAVVATVFVWWVGAETRNLINLLGIVPLAASVWLVGVGLLVVLRMIESRYPRAPVVYTLPEDREDESSPD